MKVVIPATEVAAVDQEYASIKAIADLLMTVGDLEAYIDQAGDTIREIIVILRLIIDISDRLVAFHGEENTAEIKDVLLAIGIQENVRLRKLLGDVDGS